MLYAMERLNEFIQSIDTTQTIFHKKKMFHNLPCSFDIETSSFYQSNDGKTYSNAEAIGVKGLEKKSIMYVWQFAVSDNVIIGRTWSDFHKLIEALKMRLELEVSYLVVYVHNLAYEFQFMCRMFEWENVFADSERKPIKAETKDHIIFKCSYRLSGYSLEVLAKNLTSHTIDKKTGDLDYNLIRHSYTPLTSEEIGYCVNDVLIVTAYIQEQIDEWGGVHNIPLTQTGKVRRFVRKRCFQNPKYKQYMRKLTIDRQEYLMLKLAFAGGFTHCNAMYNGLVVNNVKSYDFTSSYPTVLISEKYPMTRGKRVTVNSIDDLLRLCDNYAVLVDVTFHNIRSTFEYENIISISKCRNVSKPLVNNGRVVSAERLSTVITDVDLVNIVQMYEWDKCEVGLCYTYYKDYLPKEIIDTILTLYESKTTLKGVEGKEIEYLHGKELLNSIYGMCVTSIVHDTVTYTDHWNTTLGDIDRELDSYNNDKQRFLFYHWGVWCTAYARSNLYTAIREFGSDYIYSDTDSVKVVNADKHQTYFSEYNKSIIDKLYKCLVQRGIDIGRITPKTVKGVSKPLGVWDFDGDYNSFKTLGAKRYMYNDNGKYHITIAGLNKRKACEYIAGNENPYGFFSDGMTVDREHTGKMTHTYVDTPIEGFVTDYRGGLGYYKEQSYVHLENADYALGIASDYIEYILLQQQKLKK